MKKIILLASLLLLSSLCLGQSTTVTLQATDTPDNQQWFNGSWTAILLPPAGAGNNTQYLLPNGNPVPNISQKGTLNGTGGATLTLTPNTAITPTGTQWTISVCPQASSPCFSQIVFIFGATQTVTITPPSIRINISNSIAQVLGYADGEINTGIGQFYYNLTSNVIRVCVQIVCNGTGFVTLASGSGAVSISSGAGIINTPNPITGTGTIALDTALPNGETATTQAFGDASLDVATDQFVQNAIVGS